MGHVPDDVRNVDHALVPSSVIRDDARLLLRPGYLSSRMLIGMGLEKPTDSASAWL
jgi:hypothetical protein